MYCAAVERGEDLAASFMTAPSRKPTISDCDYVSKRFFGTLGGDITAPGMKGAFQMLRMSWIAGVTGLAGCVMMLGAQAPQQTPVPPQPATADHPARPAMPVRDAHTAGYVAGKELPDDTLP